MVWNGVKLLEKEGSNQSYEIAIQLLRCLLATNYCHHRRSKWYDRLCINLRHIDRSMEALEEARRGRDYYQSTGEVIYILQILYIYTNI